MSIAKSIAQCLGAVCALPTLISYWTFKPLVGRNQAFSAASERIARKPGLIGVYARQTFYRSTMQSVGVDVHFGFMSLLSKPDAVIGNRVYIGRFCTIGLVDIGEDVMLADAVQILSGRHQHGSTSDGQPLRENEQKFTRVTIGKGAWLGAASVVMADVGENAIVGAGAVVVKPVADNAKVAGVPAKPIAPRA